MRRLFAPIALILLVVAACGPRNLYEAFQEGLPLRNVPYIEGATLDSLERDQINCEAKAARDVPQNLVISSTPIRVSPGKTVCREIDHRLVCKERKPKVSGGETRSHDANTNLRKRVYKQCMIDTGYSFVDIPVCPEGIAVTARAGDPFPPLTARTCYRATPENEPRFWNY